MSKDKEESVKKLFTAESAKVDTNKGDTYYDELYVSCQKRIEDLKKLKPLNNRMDFTE